MTHKAFLEAVRFAAADEATIATLLNDQADALDKAGDHKRASVYRNAATNAEARARLWRQLLK